ncbi:hypothetical protein LTR10_002441 [Elasticomyces elasticus]|nr:hypothetical protein LTR10_002441 [Elasticomyces elasticus]KAK4973494.1 hypothetical protein LTR42_005482 [Elasticomyces elasticus]KAK5727426.1 hypothetical protein LTR15_003322 [Elasticomyces elasticus]
MATRRSGRLSGEKLSNKIDEIEQHGRVRFYIDRRAGWEAKHAHVKCKFTIFDLIPELRSRIYSYAMATEKPRALAFWKEPVLAMVSKQIRAESLPIFFAECLFSARVSSNYGEIANLDSLAARNLLPASMPRFSTYMGGQLIGTSYVGTLSFDVHGIKVDVALDKLQERDHIIPALRNVELHIAGPRVNDPSVSWILSPEMSTMVIKVPTASRPKPVIQWVDPARPTAHRTELALIRKKAEIKVADIAASRERFLGFTLEDLRSLAKEFGYWPAVGGI